MNTTRPEEQREQGGLRERQRRARGEAKPKTIEIGVPAVLLSRQLMGPVSVVIAWVFSIFVM